MAGISQAASLAFSDDGKFPPFIITMELGCECGASASTRFVFSNTAYVTIRVLRGPITRYIEGWVGWGLTAIDGNYRLRSVQRGASRIQKAVDSDLEVTASTEKVNKDAEKEGEKHS